MVFLTMLAILLSLACDRHVDQTTSSGVYQSIESVPKREIALVLGTAKHVQGGRLNLFYQSRIEKAAELYHAGKVRGILASGDHGRIDYNEPGQMKEDLVALGVPEKYITCDYAGFRTLDSVVRAEKVFQQTDYIVISQGFHVKRALFIANQQGHHAVGLAVKTPQGFWGNKVRLREVLARVKAVADLHVFDTKPKYLGKLEQVAKRAL